MKKEHETTLYESEKQAKKRNKLTVSVKPNKLAIGILLIVCAVVIILDAVGVGMGFLNDVPALTIILGALIVLWFMSELVKLKISGLFFPLAFLFMLFEKYIAKWAGLETDNIINNWLVLLIALLLCIGTSLILPPKKKYKTVNCSFDSNNVSSSSKNHNSQLGSSIIYIDCSTFNNERVTNELGSCQVFFSNIDQYADNGTLIVNNELGSMKINVPMGWRIDNGVSNEFGSVVWPSDKDEGDKTIHIIGGNELGSIVIQRA